ncbi:MAG: hypothetical protein MJ078_05565 [Clostridia bacterium]|nr:hypothetical protein [Clostridia bacterium]
MFTLESLDLSDTFARGELSAFGYAEEAFFVPEQGKRKRLPISVNIKMRKNVRAMQDVRQKSRTRTAQRAEKSGSPLSAFRAGKHKRSVLDWLSPSHQKSFL